MIPVTHKWRECSEGFNEVNTNKYKSPLIDALYLHRSVERLEILSGETIRTQEKGRAALEKYGHVLVDRERKILEEYFRVNDHV